MNIEDIEKFKDSPERSEGEAQISGERPKEFAGKLTVLAETLSKPKMNLSENDRRSSHEN
jgi:hypothetical protein